MAEDHRVFHDEGADGAVLPVVDIGAADSGVVYRDEDIVFAFQGGLGALFEGEGKRFIEDEGEVLVIDC